MRYIVNNNNPRVDPSASQPGTGELISPFGPDYRDISLYARHFFNGNWGVSARLDRDLMFEDVFKELPRHLIEQREQLRRERG